MQTSTASPSRLASSAQVSKPRPRLSSTELVIYLRMRDFDRGLGCSASVKRIAGGVERGPVDFALGRHRCARVINRLAELGAIKLEGQVMGGLNLYTFPDRTYDRAQLEQLLILPAGEVRQ